MIISKTPTEIRKEAKEQKKRLQKGNAARMGTGAEPATYVARESGSARRRHAIMWTIFQSLLTIGVQNAIL